MLTIHTVQPPSYHTHIKISVYNLTVLTKIWNVTPIGTGRGGKVLKHDLYTALSKYNERFWYTMWTRVSIGEYMSTEYFVEAKYFYLLVKEKSNDPNIEHYQLPLAKDGITFRKFYHFYKDNSLLSYDRTTKVWHHGGSYIGNGRVYDELEKLRKALAYIDIFYMFVKLRFLYQNIDCHTDIMIHSIQHYLEYFAPELLQFKFA